MSDGHTHSSSCGCGKPAKEAAGCSAASSASSKETVKGSQNGKGDAPRNVSLRFRSNYGAIDWGTSRSSKPKTKAAGASKVKKRVSR